MGILKSVEWKEDAKDTVVYKLDLNKDYIAKGSKLTVREGQAVVFCDKGKMADVFLPGFYVLDTNNVPLLTKMMSWKYGFESPFKSDIYFVNTKQFTNFKWGTVNPIIIRDNELGPVRVRGFGSYSFKIDDPYVFLTELVGSGTSFKTSEVVDYLRSMVVTGISDAIGESKLSVFDVTGNLLELGKIVQKSLDEDFKSIGLKLTKLNFENFSTTSQVEKALDDSASLGILSKNMNTYMAKAQADAMQSAAKNPGMANAGMNAGMGMGMGMGMGRAFNNMFDNQNNQQQPNSSDGSFIACSKCGHQVKAGAKFCADCGNVMGLQCPKCKAVVKDGCKFCPDCGSSLASSCNNCGKPLKPGAKFCAECGTKV